MIMSLITKEKDSLAEIYPTLVSCNDKNCVLPTVVPFLHGKHLYKSVDFGVVFIGKKEETAFWRQPLCLWAHLGSNQAPPVPMVIGRVRCFSYCQGFFELTPDTFSNFGYRLNSSFF